MNIVFSLLVIAAGGYWMIAGVSYKMWVNHGPGGGVFPVAGGLIVVVFGIVYLIGELRKKSIVKFRARMLLPVVSVLLAVFASYLLGLLVSLAGFVLLWLKAVEKYSWKKSLCIGIGTGLALYLIFDFWLKVPVPAGKIAMLFGAV